MAERDYMRGEGVTPIQDMSTRQLRKYIRERATEAQARVSSIRDIEGAPKALQDQVDYVRSFGSGIGGAVKKDTSRMDKMEMVEYAYALRDLNMLDTVSKFSKDDDYNKNRERYETFVRNQLKSLNPNSRKYWKQFETKKGNISKKGYQEYKDFVNWIKNMDEVMTTYGYETTQDIYYDQGDSKDKSDIEQLLLDTYQENKGKGMTTKDLIDDFYNRLDNSKKSKQAPKKPKTKKASAPKAQKSKKVSAPKVQKGKKSSQNIKVKEGAKLRNGTVREKQGTQRL